MVNLHGDNELTIGQRHGCQRLVLFIDEKNREWSIEAQALSDEPGKTWTEDQWESEELVLSFGTHRPAVLFTAEGMKTICPVCGGHVVYERVTFIHTEGAMTTTWHCTKCGHPKAKEAEA